MASITERIVDKDNGPGTHFTSLNNWKLGFGDVANSGDLVGEDTIAKALLRCTAGTRHSGAQFNPAWTSVDSTHYVWIKADPTYQHTGWYPVGDTGNIVRMRGGQNLLDNWTQPFMVVEGIAFQKTAAAGWGLVRLNLSSPAPHDCQFVSCVIDGTQAATAGGFEYGLTSNGARRIIIANCVGYGWAGVNTYAIGFINGADSSFITNCTFADNNGAWIFGNDYTVRNTLCHSNTFSGWPPYHVNNDTNADDVNNLGANFIDVSGVAAADLFNDPTNRDYRLKADAPLVRGVGLDLSADAYPILYDAFGTERLPDFDLGFHQITTPPLASPTRYFRRGAIPGITGRRGSPGSLTGRRATYVPAGRRIEI